MAAAIFIVLLSASVFAAGYDIGGSVGIYVKVTNDTSELNDDDNPVPTVLPDNYGDDDNRGHNNDNKDETDSVDDSTGTNDLGDNYYNNENTQENSATQDLGKEVSIIFQNHVGITGQYQTDDKYAYTGEDIISQVYVKGDNIDMLIISLGSKEEQCAEDLSSLNYGDEIPEGFSEQSVYDESMKYYTCTVKVDESIVGEEYVKIIARDSSGNDITEKREEFYINMPLMMEVIPGNEKLFVQNNQTVPMTIRQSCNGKFMSVDPNNYRNVRLDECRGNYLVGSVE